MERRVRPRLEEEEEEEPFPAKYKQKPAMRALSAKVRRFSRRTASAAENT